MADEYIRRKDAIEEIDKWLDAVGTALVGKGMSYYGELIGCIEDTPAADVAPVVRCKDCQNWKRNVGLTDSPNGHCFEHDIDTNGRDFCSYGERMRRSDGWREWQWLTNIS